METVDPPTRLHTGACRETFCMFAFTYASHRRLEARYHFFGCSNKHSFVNRSDIVIVSNVDLELISLYNINIIIQILKATKVAFFTLTSF